MSPDHSCSGNGLRDGNGSSHKKVATIEDIDACLGKLAEDMTSFREGVVHDLQAFRVEFERRSKTTETEITLIRKQVQRLGLRTAEIENDLLEHPTPLPEAVSDGH